jgi:hypothetical protein
VYLERTWFESRTPIISNIFVIFLCPSECIRGECFKIGHDSFPFQQPSTIQAVPLVWRFATGYPPRGFESYLRSSEVEFAVHWVVLEPLSCSSPPRVSSSCSCEPPLFTLHSVFVHVIIPPSFHQSVELCWVEGLTQRLSVCAPGPRAWQPVARAASLQGSAQAGQAFDTNCVTAEAIRQQHLKSVTVGESQEVEQCGTAVRLDRCAVSSPTATLAVLNVASCPSKHVSRIAT